MSFRHPGGLVTLLTNGVQMGMRSQKPDPRRETGAPVWKYQPVENGKYTVGFLAGPTVGVHCHYHGKSKPCRTHATEGALTCPYCSPDDIAQWRGFVPYYDREYVRRFVCIGPEYAEATDEIPLHAQVKIMRPLSSKASCIVRAEAFRPLPMPVTKDREHAADLLPSLFRVWKDSELEAWHRANPDEKPRPTAAAKPSRYPIEDIPAGRDAGEAEMTAIRNRLNGRFTVKDAVGGIGVDPHEKPHSNGKPKPK